MLEGSSSTSSSWMAQKKNVVRIFELFRSSLPMEVRDALAPHPFEELSEEKACNPQLYDEFANFQLPRLQLQDRVGALLEPRSRCRASHQLPPHLAEFGERPLQGVRHL
mmetsp:Transcript_3536/g.10966  ORF Transcript_3536/g.10966 Transcript_3536/m.10966 type:complete len:109 (+) Transcript_3536:177-503(+)